MITDRELIVLAEAEDERDMPQRDEHPAQIHDDERRRTADDLVARGLLRKVAQTDESHPAYEITDEGQQALLEQTGIR